jgi:hypothetical protein
MHKAAYLFCLLAAGLTTGSANAAKMGKPLAAEICPTSSFGSGRWGHLHAGLDVSTGGRTGVPVLAVDSCWVWRIRIWHGGYGKALYAELPDGKIAVYGHLSRFSPEIEAAVEQEQDLRGNYEVEMYYEPHALGFSRGDTLAYSGATGSGPPHLHFELRSGRHDHSSINPIPEYLDLYEMIPPRIKAVRVEPLSGTSAIQGDYRPLTLSKGSPPETIAVDGPFGLSVHAVDPVQCGRILTPIVYEAWVDGRPAWKLALDRFPFAKTHFVGGLYHRIGTATYVRLYPAYGLDLGGFTCTADAAWTQESLDRATYDVAIRVSDAWGNADSLDILLRHGRMPEFAVCSLTRDTTGVTFEIEPRPPDCKVAVASRSGGAGWNAVDVSEDGGTFSGRIEDVTGTAEVLCRIVDGSGLARECILAPEAAGAPESVDVDIAVRSSHVEVYTHTMTAPSGLPRLKIHEGSLITTEVLQPVGPETFRTVYTPRGIDPVIHLGLEVDFGGDRRRTARGLVVRRLTPGSSFWFIGERFKVRLSAPSAYSAVTLVTMDEDDGSLPRGFAAVLGRLILEPEGVFFNDRVEVLVVPRDTVLASTCGLFRDGDRPSFLGRFDSTQSCQVGLQTLGSVVVLEDTEPPAISSIGRLELRSADGKALFTAKVVDEGSGIDAQSLRAYVDGEVAIVGYDFDTGRISGRTTKALHKGAHRIRLEAKDRMGNSSSREVTVEVTG